MPAGLQVWDAAGVLRVDTSSRVAKIVGSVNTNGQSGQTLTDTSRGTPFYYVNIDRALQSNFDDFEISPDVWFEGNTLKWNYRYMQNVTNVPVRITYGYF